MGHVLLVLFGAAIGMSLGVTGIGGFLIPPVLISALGIAPRDAVAYALLSFIPTGSVGAWLYSRQERLDRVLAVVLSIGTVPGIAIGRAMTLSLSDVVLQRVLAIALLVIALLLVTRGAQLVSPKAPVRHALSPVARVMQVVVMLLAGCLGGIAGVIAGVGGPLIVVPLLAMMGFELSRVVGAALLNSVVVALLGAATLVPVTTIDWVTLAVVAIPQFAGLIVGVRARRFVNSERLSYVIAAFTLLGGLYVLFRT